ncbi:DHHA1 domain-containing protein [Neobacillus niacini]|uniref:alanyl-tRNA editing protein n=1 Tax=Neobacillus niacini TaxID=86668 RepID=UPI0021CAFF0D|nr:DHHA1 domain-containing protein [Neobacillus niacini]MCM3765903.1 DHHA1 domain-containing protein [Neobacillus niacini]
MLNSKLYYRDPYIKSFDAEVLKQEKDQEGNWYVVLNQTAFYPTGGGQPFDTGTIAGQKVINVEEIDGEIRHYLNAPLSETSGRVEGEIDWHRRFDHMQQHLGQHILSAAFEQLYDFETIGFHLGNEIVTIDLETEALTQTEIERVETLANQAILENRPIEVKWVTQEELTQYPLRKETKVKENIRLVIIPDFDYNGCGGTHPKATGEVRALKILDWERQKKKVRLQFICGDRVINQLGQKQKVLLQLTKLLNAPEQEMEQVVVRLLEQRKVMDKSVEQLKEELLEYEAKELIEKHQAASAVSEVFQNRSIQELQKLARMIIGKNENTAALLVSQQDDRLQLVCARGSARTENMRGLAQSAFSLINGKGGGNDSFAQGGGPAQISGSELLQYLTQSLMANQEVSR